MNEAKDTRRRNGKSVSKQVSLAFMSNFSNIAPGMSIGFSAVAIPALTSLNSQQISWFASIAPFATPIGCICSGPIADRFGRKCALTVVNITASIGWLIIASAFYIQDQQYEILLVGRFLTGLATGLCGSPAAVYMAEIASAELRSVFTTWVSLFYALGIFVVYLLGMVLKDDWCTISLIAAGFPIIGMVFLELFIPESPSWLVSKQRFDEAKRNMCRLYGTKIYSDEVRSEVETLIDSGRAKKEKSSEKTLAQQFIRKLKMLMKKSFLKPYALVLTFFVFQQFTGIFVIMFYAIDIVNGAKIQVDSYITIVVIASLRLVGMIMVSFFSKHFGRRPLCLVSGSGITISMIMLGSYILAIKQGLISEEQEKSLTLIPLVLLMFYFFISTMGFYPMPFAIASEVYPRNVRGTASGVSGASNFIFNFLMVKLYPTMVETMGSHGVFFFFGIFGFLGTLFVLFFLPETRGKTLEEIQQYFQTKNEDIVLDNQEKA